MEEKYKRTAKGNFITCAVITQNETGDILAVHPTGQKFDQNWSLPKGLAGESELDGNAACREFQEETGIPLIEEGLSRCNLEDLGVHSYLKGKDIHLFRVTALPVLLDTLYCKSTFERTDVPGMWMSEVDSFRWIGPDQWDKFSKGIREVLTRVLKPNS